MKVFLTLIFLAAVLGAAEKTNDETLQELGKLTLQYLNYEISKSDLKEFAAENNLLKEQHYKKKISANEKRAAEAAAQGYTVENFLNGTMPIGKPTSN